MVCDGPVRAPGRRHPSAGFLRRRCEPPRVAALADLPRL